MEKTEIIRKLDEELKLLMATLKSLSAQQFFQQPENNKWSVAQTTHHLILSVRPLILAFSLPSIVLRIFGKPVRSLTYDELVKTYQQRLAAGAKASGAFIPGSRGNDQAALIGRLMDSYHAFARKVEATGETKLDKLRLPHPILGKITMREMTFFTVYHIQHHHRIVKERLLLI